MLFFESRAIDCVHLIVFLTTLSGSRVIKCSNFSVFGLNPSRRFVVRRLRAGVLRQPDHTGSIDKDFMDAVLGVWQHVVFLLSGARIQLDQAMGVAAIGQPYVAVLIEANILTGTSADKRLRQLVEFRRFRSLARWIRRQVVLDVHRLAELGFIERHFLLDADRTRLAAEAEVLDQVAHGGLRGPAARNAARNSDS